jgi:hypothetical protein
MENLFLCYYIRWFEISKLLMSEYHVALSIIIIIIIINFKCNLVFTRGQ